MKKHFYYCLIVLLFSAAQIKAQYITSSSSSALVTPGCDTSAAVFRINVAGLMTTTVSVTAYYGDGTSHVGYVSASGSTGYAYFGHVYQWPGNYTAKFVLKLGTTVLDSLRLTYVNRTCLAMNIFSYVDNNSDCIPNLGDNRGIKAATIEVDSIGIPVDTIYSLFGYNYYALGPAGTVYTYRVLAAPDGTMVTCPSSGIITDTVPGLTLTTPGKPFGFVCSPSSSFDLGQTTSVKLGSHRFEAHILTSTYCLPASCSLSMSVSSRFSFSNASPMPTVVAGNTITWDSTAIALNPTNLFFAHYEVTGTSLTPGDTLHSDYLVNPVTGDANPIDNDTSRVDTSRSGWDPNMKTVSPSGHINAGTELEYTIQFENTGNDTAFNIHIMDTLSPYIEAQTFRIVAASHAMVLSMDNVGGQNIVKFDFPNINLLDSSHHGLCDGMVVYKIKTKSSLPDGTVIDNRAGIYFDENDVVMTNTAENIIGFPNKVSTLTNAGAARLFPNPVSDVLNIGLSSEYSVFSISNTVGQTVGTGTLDGKEAKVNVRDLPTGIYYITLRGAGGVNVQKFEKR